MANAWLLRPAPMGNATAGATSAGSALNVGNDHAGLVWRASATATTLDLDFSGNVWIDTVMLLGLDLADAGATLQVSGRTQAQGPFGGGGANSWDGTTQPLFAGAQRLVGGKGVGLWSRDPSATLARHVRLSFAGLGGAIEVARVAAGARIVPQRNFVFGRAAGVREFGSVDFSARGALLRRRSRRLRTAGLSFESLHQDEVEAAIQPLLELVGNTDPVGLVTDPEPHAMRQRRCWFGPLVGDLGTVQRSAAGWRASVNLVSLF